MRRAVWPVLVALLLAAAPAALAGPCRGRVLVLSAYPGEIDRLLSETAVSEVRVTDGRELFVGTLRGNDVVLALSGIGLVNAARTTESAIESFRCNDQTEITGIVFSGVAGGRNIGDVMVPLEWSDDGGTTRLAASAAMLAVAQNAAATVALTKDVATGDAACVGVDPEAVATISLPHQPDVVFGGFGSSADGFGARAFPCFPGGGDVFGCRPCRAPGVAAPDVARFAENVVPFMNPAFFFEYFQMPAPPAGAAAVDMETGAVARVAASNGIPFIAFRGASDGAGDPLGLPGFPFQFFFYRQVAAENAARMTLAFLQAWALQ